MRPDDDPNDWGHLIQLTNLRGLYVGDESPEPGTPVYSFAVDGAPYGHSNDAFWVGVTYNAVEDSASTPDMMQDKWLDSSVWMLAGGFRATAVLDVPRNAGRDWAFLRVTHGG